MKAFMFSGRHEVSRAGAKMEAGQNPARSRHCIEGVLLNIPLHLCPDIKRTEDGCGKVSKALIAESGDMHKLFDSSLCR